MSKQRWSPKRIRAFRCYRLIYCAAWLKS